MKILNPEENLDYNKITLGNPTPIQGGSYFTKLKIDDNQLYAQMPKCLTRKGIVHTEKNDYCDLMYERNDEEQLIDWIENIEMCCQTLIDKKKHIWFHTDLSRDDISTMMTPICRIYRSGKNILIRVNVDKNKHSGQTKCIAYNEEESLVETNTLLPDQKIIPLVCIDGIKFTSRSFEICISLTQFMLLNKEEDLETNKKCMISLNKSGSINNDSYVSGIPNTKEDVDDTFIKGNDLPDASIVVDVGESNISLAENTRDTLDLGNTEVDPQSNSMVGEKENNNIENTNLKKNEEYREPIVDKPIVDEPIVDEPIVNEPIVDEPIVNEPIVDEPIVDEPIVEEVSLDLNNSGESIQLKKSSEVYYEIYKDAKRKAKEMREAALKAYLEAEKIKMKFSLDDMGDESDFDDSGSDVSDTSSISETPSNLAEN